MLVAENLVFSYKNKKIFDGLSLCVGERERVGILAPSGFGKTTLLRLLGGYLQPDSGWIEVDGSSLPKKGYCPVQLIWQHPEKAVNPRLRMEKTLREGAGVDRRLEERLGIEQEWKTRFPRELSGGELQRFCIARSLGPQTRYLLCDEITAMLDLITQGQIWRFLIEETKRRGIGMVIASHSRELLDYVCTRQIDLTDSGRKEEEYGYDANGRAGSADQI